MAISETIWVFVATQIKTVPKKGKAGLIVECMRSPSDVGRYIITLGTLLVQSNNVQLKNKIKHMLAGEKKN